MKIQKKIIAIGGGENGRKLENGDFAPYNTVEIDKEIIKLSNKKNPNFLFINHAMPSLEIQESYFQTMKKIYGDIYKCNCDDLKTIDLDDINCVKQKIEWADIIYEGGGDTAYMINLWEKKGFDKILYNAWQSGKVISGISAGAVCWFNSCNSDSSNNEDNNLFSNIDCLKWINIHITPHCEEVGRRDSTKLQLKENGLIGVLLSNCSALEIIDEQYKFIRSDNKAFALKSYYKNDKYIEKECDFDVYKNIDDLLEKN